MDLETGNIEQVSVKKGRKLKVLGFLGEDLVYGLTKDENKKNITAGMEQTPMYALRIVSGSDTELLKKYQKSGYYISNVEFVDGVLIIHRLILGEGGYTQTQQDSIVNRNQDTSELEVIHTTVTERRQTQVQLVLPESEPDSQPVYVAARLVMNREDRETSLKSEQEKQSYFAYAWGKVEKVSTDLSEAIRSADENMGVVVDNEQNYIWNRARKSIVMPLDVEISDADASGTPVEKCVSAMLKNEGVEVDVGGLLDQGQTIQEIMESLLSGRKVLNIMGCSLTQILYYVGCGTPVMAVADAGQVVLVTGYDAVNVWIYDPGTGGNRHLSHSTVKVSYLAEPALCGQKYTKQRSKENDRQRGCISFCGSYYSPGGHYRHRKYCGRSYRYGIRRSGSAGLDVDISLLRFVIQIQ